MKKTITVNLFFTITNLLFAGQTNEIKKEITKEITKNITNTMINNKYTDHSFIAAVDNNNLYQWFISCLSQQTNEKIGTQKKFNAYFSFIEKITNDLKKKSDFFKKNRYARILKKLKGHY